MPRYLPVYLSVVLIALIVSGCEIIGDILAFGFWVGVIVVAVMVLIVWAFVRQIRGRRRA